MARITIGSWLKSLVPVRGPGIDDRNQVDLSGLQEACDRLAVQLGEESLSRSELMNIAADLRPIGRRLLHLVKETRGRDGHTRATHLGEEALQHIYDCLYSIQAFRPYVRPEHLRHKLRRTLAGLDEALIALRWAQAQPGAA